MLVPVNSVSLLFSGWVISMLYPDVPKLVRLDSDFGGPWSLMWCVVKMKHFTDLRAYYRRRYIVVRVMQAAF